MEIIVLDRTRKNSLEAASKIRANNMIFNVKSQFENNSPIEELLFRISEQKFYKVTHEKTAVGTLAVPFDK